MLKNSIRRTFSRTQTKTSLDSLISDGFAVILRMINDATQREFCASLMVERAHYDTEANDQVAVNGAMSCTQNPTLERSTVINLSSQSAFMQLTFEMMTAPQKNMPTGVRSAA